MALFGFGKKKEKEINAPVCTCKIVYNTYIPLVIIHDVTILVINLDNKMITGAF